MNNLHNKYKSQNLSVAILASLAVLFSSYADARDYTFNPSMLKMDGQDVDLSVFENGSQLPGIYHVDIVLNGKLTDRKEIVFYNKYKENGEHALTPCLTQDMLTQYGIRTGDYPGIFIKGADGEVCGDVSVIPGSTIYFDFYNQQLNLSIPNIAFYPKYNGIAPKSLWDDGINAFVMNYQANAMRNEFRQQQSKDVSSYWARIEPGLNLGPWRIRNLTTLTKEHGKTGDSESVYTYAERGIPSIKSRILIGESYTNSDIFDSIPFRGAMLRSDESMVPYSQYGFAPVIRGIAQSQALIEVRQNGYLIHTVSVAPGAFALADIPVIGSGGDLQVSVIETNGKNQVFTVPYTTPVIALREGYLKYNITGGVYRSSYSGVEDSALVQMTAMYGLPWDLTTFVGFQGAEHYQSAATGLGLSMGKMGAISLDGIYARGHKKDQSTDEGYSWRIRYSKLFDTTGTSFIAASHQYSSSGYHTLSDVLDTYSDKNYFYSDQIDRSRRTSLTMSQSMGKWGMFSLGGVRDEYRGGRPSQDSVNASYTTNWEWGSLSLNWSENKNTLHYLNNSKSKKENLFSIWMNIPMDRLLGNSSNNINVTTYVQKSTGQKTQYEFGLNGRAFNRQLYWDIRQQFAPGTDTYNDSSRMNLIWYGTYGQLRGGYSYSDSLRQMNAGLSGTMVIHNKGITFGQSHGETMALVEAPAVDGAEVIGWPGVKTDFRGYTTLGHLVPYQENTVSLNPASFPDYAEVSQTDTRVIPTKGAIVPARFITHIGEKVLFKLTRNDGKKVPFGAVVSLSTKKDNKYGAGIVNELGEVYMTGLPEKGELNVRWNSHGKCTATYELSGKKNIANIHDVSVTCL
ncbi:fimbria/pilus outer membrane usher protein [Escherichia coli]|nr:fimbria/pilus outer membrane usher protein [Escherichia coli]